MDIPDNFDEIIRSALSKFESSHYRMSIYCMDDKIEEERRLRWRASCREWHNYVIRGMFTVMSIIAETCIEQVSAGIDPKDLKFYQKCERNGETVIFEFNRMARIWWEESYLSIELPEFYGSYESWVQSFLDKMKSLNTESSLMAAARVKHAREYYGKSLEEFRGRAKTSYVDADPTREDQWFDPVMFYTIITSMFMTVRELLTCSPLTTPVPRTAPARKNSPPAMARTRSPPRMNTSRRSFADVLMGRNRR